MSVDAKQAECGDCCSKHIEDLPTEIFILILNNIRLKELLRLRTVCKSWLEKINSLRSPKLFTSYGSKNLVFTRHTNNRIDFHHHFIRIHPSQFHSFVGIFNNTIFKTLKDLRVFNLDLAKRSKTFFETITTLQHLESFTLIDPKNLDKQTTLHSNTLKYFEIEYIQINNLRIVLETASLKTVKNVSSTSLELEFKHPQSIEMFELDRYTDDLDDYKFTNLKDLHVRIISVVSSKFLSKLESLEVLSLNGNFNVFKNVFAQKAKYKRTNLKIYLTGLLADKLEEYESMIANTFINPYILTNRLVASYMKHHSRLIDNLMLFDSINHNITDELDQTFENDLFKRLTGIQSIYIDCKIQDEQRFIEFSKNFSNLCVLSIKQQLLSQNLLNSLPNLFPYLQSFSVDGFRQNYDIEFIFKFKYLQCSFFNICFKESKCTLEKFFDLKYFWSLGFRGEEQSMQYRDSTISIAIYSNRLVLSISYAKKNPRDAFDEYEEKKFGFDSIYELIKFLEAKELVR